ncbi:hypothetical protein [Herbidospora mongoliensis]|uniref:hypothetical protein n=1 Tax=Herbidospora mongoliensis TaxID=688067 RepID=UPI000829BA14|nr:hypothetical protein [Herbidospora mongoliensis]
MKWISLLAIVSLATNCQWTSSATPLRAPDTAATSVEQIAARLDPLQVRRLPTGDTERPLYHPLVPECDAGEDVEVRHPGYTALLRSAESPDPIGVRIWITGPDEAKSRTDGVRAASTRCFAHSMSSITRQGWNAEVLTWITPTSSDNGDPIAQVSVTAYRGPFLAEVSWWWPSDHVNRGRLDRGLDAAMAVLGAVGGDPGLLPP